MLRGSRSTERSVGLSILVACLLAFIIVPFFSHDPYAFGLPQQAPSSAHWFGTDQMGRDIFARVFLAGRLDLLITVVGLALNIIMGTLVGLLLATAHQYVRAALLRFIDAFISLPFLVIVMALVDVIGHRQAIPFLSPSVGAIILAIVVVGWAGFARFTVLQALAVRERDHVVAARLLGYSRMRIMVRHIAPSVIGVNLSLGAGSAIGYIGLVASLAFVGAGVQEPTPDLGSMMSAGVSLLPVAWWITIIPGLVVLLLGIGFALVVDANGR